MKKNNKPNQVRIGVRGKSDIWFERINTLLVILITIVCFYPIYYTVIASFSDPNAVIGGDVYLTIIKPTLDSYRTAFGYSAIWTGYRNTLIYTIFGTLYSLFLLLPASYALSRPWLKGRSALIKICMFTMYFGGGTIPTYLLMKSLNLLDSPLAIILPGAFSVYNMIITRTFFEGFSESLCEAARIDGAGELRVFLRIVLPLSGSIVAVMALYHAVAHWNSYFNAMIYLKDRELFPLQLILREVLLLNSSIVLDAGGDIDAILDFVRREKLAETMKYSMIIIANLPILVAYPFVQKYFVKGVMIGSVKG